MNERFQQILKQSTNPPWDGEQGPMNEFNLEKCFELIVRECIERVCAQYTSARDQLIRTEYEQGVVECGVASVIALEELVQESTDQWYKENILGVGE